MDTREAYVARMKVQLDEMNKRMNELEASAKQSRDDVAANYHKQVAHLQAQSQAAIVKLEELRAAGENGWESMVGEMDKVRDAFAHAFSKFKS